MELTESITIDIIFWVTIKVINNTIRSITNLYEFYWLIIQNEPNIVGVITASKYAQNVINLVMDLVMVNNYWDKTPVINCADSINPFPVIAIIIIP